MTRQPPAGPRRLVGALAGAVLVAALAGCARPRPSDLTATAVPPVPADLVEGAAAVGGGGGPQPDCGDPTASLSPTPLPPPGQMPSGSTMARIVARGYLIAGVDQNTYLFGYRNPTNNDIEGFDIDMVHDVAQDIFGDPNKVVFKALTSDQRITALQNGSVDIVAETMTINCARRTQVAFSTVYFQSGQRVLVDRDSRVTGIDQLGGQKVCAAVGSDSLAQIAERPTHPIPVSVDDWSDCLVLLQQGEVAAVSTDDTILAGLVAQDPNTKIVGPQFTSEPYGLAVPRQDSDFVRFVNAVLDQIRGNGSWTASYQHWIQDRLGPVPPPPAPTYSD